MHWHAHPLSNPRALTRVLFHFLILWLLQLPHEVLFPLFPLRLLLPQELLFSKFFFFQFLSRLQTYAQEVLPLSFCRVCNCQLLHYWQHVTRSAFKRSANSRAERLSRLQQVPFFFSRLQQLPFPPQLLLQRSQLLYVLSSLRSCAVQSTAVETENRSSFRRLFFYSVRSSIRYCAVRASLFLLRFFFSAFSFFRALLISPMMVCCTQEA